VLLNRNPVGAAFFTAIHSLQLNPRGRDYTEQVTIGGVRLVGNAGGIHVALGDSCGNTCTPTGNNFPVGAILRNGLHGTLTFHDSIGKGHEASLRNKYVWLFVKAGFTPGSVTYFTPLFYRCDEMISSFPGCVFSEFTPVMTSMQGLAQIRANIRRIQGHGLHLGEFGQGHPLHHITDVVQQNSNYSFMCPRSRPRPRGKQCDEYPFKTTKEGGRGAPANSRGWAWVPASEQRSQGGRISQFYQGNRVLNGDAFWVLV
jgi:Deoxyribonuclease NucA/NucB